MTPRSVVLTADETLTSTFRRLPLADFLSCVPYEKVPKAVYRLLDTQLPHRNGILVEAPYSLRKVEAALIEAGYRVVVAHPRHIHRFIREDTAVVGVSTMDPLGLGPVSIMFTAGVYTAYSAVKFRQLTSRINMIRERRGLKFKLVVGGPGAWQLEGRLEELRVDHAVIGETEHVIGALMQEIIEDKAPSVIHVAGYPSVDEIPVIRGASYKGMVEVMRGCGRGCSFCTPNLRVARYIPLEKVKAEIEVNVRAGLSRAWIHGDDIFLYRLEDKRSFHPNTEAIVELFREVTSIRGIREANPTHASIAPVVADERLLPELSDALKASRSHWIGVQPGLETGSPRLIRMHMRNKAKPFQPEEWPEVALEATRLLNLSYWFPAYTLIVGLPGEEEEDCWLTARLIASMRRLRRSMGERGHFAVTPLAYISATPGSRWFRPLDDMTEARFHVIYQAWLATAEEVQRSASMFTRGLVSSIAVNPVLKLGAKLILNHLRTWGRKMGYDPDRRVEPLDLPLHASIPLPRR